ncbi:outer membrane protein assembly factor BamB [Methanolinea mesophila]|uniref:beta-alanine-activating enzyme beta-propeller domain-containing protein n=1 Tax=Methanolinea mesophila TaxID=547055 RepID=UPI001AE5D2D2|nr:PQQ-binding-like beta-propeller repeat protein [Methanolinea mesophila]MBP1928954.1 outer membrane protein assembly factor BamB [Methanolinea mesophila]
MKPIFVITVMCILIFFASSSAAAVEPAWKSRSDLSNSGIYDDGGTRPDGTLLWNYTTGREVRSCPAIVDGVVYFGSNDGNLYAIDAKTGSLVWNSAAGLGIQTGPAVTGGVVYAGSWDHNIYAFDMSSGALLWNTTTGDAVISSPAVANGIVYAGSFDGKVYALDAVTGEPIWEYTTGGPRVTSSPAIVEGVVYVGSEDKNLYALNASDGALLWNTTTGGQVHSSPSVANGAVYFGSDDFNVYALDASTGSLLWTAPTGDTVRSSPAVADGVVYVGSYDENMYALDASTGTVIWSHAMGDEVDSSPAVANGVVYVGTLGYGTNFYALDAASGSVLWDHSMGEWFVYSDPAVADGMVFVGCDDGTLSAFGASKEEPLAYDTFDDNTCNTTLWEILESGGAYVEETNQRLEITIPADASGETFYAGYASTGVLRGDFDVQVDYHLLTWPQDSGVRMGLWIEREPVTCTVERASYSDSDSFSPGEYYTTNFADSILLSATGDTDGRMRLVRTGSTIYGYRFDETSGDWVLLQEKDVTGGGVSFVLRAWSHDYAFADSLVKVAFDNFVINSGEVIDLRTTPPSSVTDLRNATFQPDMIRWTWTDPGEPDFDHVMVYLDGVFMKNVTKGEESWTARRLAPSTAYTIGTRTVGEQGAINGTWVNQTATTSALSVSRLDPASAGAGSPGFTLNVYGTAFSEDCRVVWNGDERTTQFLPPDRLSIDVSAEDLVRPASVNVTVRDSATGALSNTVFFTVKDPLADRTGWKFRSDRANSGVYDDGGTRPGSEVLWKVMTENYYGSTPAVADGVVYVCGIYDINAIDAFTGTLLWTSPYGGGRSSPAVEDDVVYVGNTDKTISALDAATGDLLWQYTTGGIVYSSPTVADGVVYAGSWDNNLYALDAGSGALLWNYTTGGDHVDSSPAVANDIVYFGSGDGNVYALGADTGTLVWKYPTGDSVSCSPAVVDGVVYIGSDDGSLYALDAYTGSLLWNALLGGYVQSSPGVADGVVYVGAVDGRLYALDAATGDPLWNYMTGSWVHSPSIAQGVVYAGSSDHTLYALDAATGNLLWSYTTGDVVYASPAVANGVVYVQSNDGWLTALATVPDGPPDSVTGLHTTIVNGVRITWTWTDPGTLGFSRVKVYLDGVFREEVPAGTGTWTATGLAPSTVHTIGLQTVGVKGAVNATVVTDTATTGTLSISSLDPGGVVEDDPSFPLNVYGTGFTGDCTILWNGDPQSTLFVQPDLLSMEVPAEYVAHSGRVEITVYDRASGESSNTVTFPVTDNPATATARKFRSDLANSGVYDDGGKRPVPTVLWAYDTGSPVSSSPSVADGVVYIGSHNRNLYALDALSGDLLWQYDSGERNDYVSSSPAVSNGVVYIGGMKYKIHAVDAYSGDLLWDYKLPIRTTIRSSISSSAAVSDGVVYIGNMDGTVYAFSEEDGDLLWTYAMPRTEYGEYAIFSSPAVADGMVYIHSYGGALYALDAATGAFVWNSSNLGAYGSYSSPAFVDGVVYVGSSYDHGFRAFDALTGDLLWKFTTNEGVSSSPAVSNGVVYLADVDGTVFACNASTGDSLWSYPTGERVSSSPAVAGGVVYIGGNGEHNNLYAFDAETGDLLWTFNARMGFVSSPAVVNGILYIGGNDGKVYALGTVPIEPPVAEFSANTTAGNAPLPVAFTDTSTGVVTTKFWDFGDGATEWANETQAVSHTYSFPGTFTVSLSAGNADGQDTMTKPGYIQVSPTGRPPRALFGIMANTGPAPMTVRFTDRSLGSPTGWQWDFGDGTTSTEQSPTHVYMTAGTFTPRLTVSNAGGTSTYKSYIWVRAKPAPPTTFPTKTVTPTPTISPSPGSAPIAMFAMNTSVGFDPMTVQFTDRSFQGPTDWLWNFGDGGNSTLQNPVHTFLSPGTYPVRLSVSNEHGQSDTTRTVYVR